MPKVRESLAEVQRGRVVGAQGVYSGRTSALVVCLLVVVVLVEKTCHQCADFGSEREEEELCQLLPQAPGLTACRCMRVASRCRPLPPTHPLLLL